MLKDIIIIDLQGKEVRAQASYIEIKTPDIIRSARAQSPKVEYILVKGEFIYPTLDLLFNSSDGNSYYIE